MVLAAFVMPHPPVMIPEIGGGREKEIQKTIDACHECGREIARFKPDTIVLCSPHANVRDEELDHGTTVPLYFVEKYYPDYELIRVEIAGYSLQENYEYGKKLAQYLNENNKRAVFIASGDLSHVLFTSEEGARLDVEITGALADGDFKRLMSIPPELIEKGAECGLRPFAMMAGVLNGDNRAVTPKLLSYEGTFGVGYAVASFIPRESEQVKLARVNIESFVKTGKTIEIPENLPDEMLNKKAGVFVSLKINGNLRGCIGTITPVTESVAQEILRNSVCAAAEDPRFPPVEVNELDNITYSVDVLGAPEAIESVHELDVIKYGVIVASGFKRGLLLPNLDGVDTAEQQVSIALQKAGIRKDEPYTLERFEVIRYT
ncbi:MAG: AmmeMemoRadiSam system protein A [Oscillospiraceae bacterium]|nr:AmmeMemoRadiSam system protein A [Oscillospiraceae bacterium]